LRFGAVVALVDFRGAAECFADAAANIFRTDMPFEVGLFHQLGGLFARAAKKKRAS
jgi:hypothetical protein